MNPDEPPEDFRHLLLVLGDQLSPGLDIFKDGDPERDLVLLAEIAEEASYVRHHKKKIAFVFSAMRHFAQELRESGWRVHYIRLDSEKPCASLKEAVARTLAGAKAEAVRVTEPGEFRLLDEMRGWQSDLEVQVDLLPDSRFLCALPDFRKWAEGRKRFLMEDFYRHMRQKTGLLMEEGNPAGGKWNFDKENRSPAPSGLVCPEPIRHRPDEITQDVLELVSERFADHFGALEPFWFAVTREEAEAVFESFLENGLADFGTYQDAMLKSERFLYHSLISMYLNAGLLDAWDICVRVEKVWRSGAVPLNCAEGFIRQILGWREYVRGIYWLKMPEYRDENFFGAKRDLPEFYWTGETDMACLKAVIEQTLDEAYAHHIQRLMVTGNFALLIGADPVQVHEWYLSVYADAYEWVELPNTLGMSLHADGGFLGSKPYAASGNYIGKMSDYCSDCAYDVKKKTGEGACPFNALYWDFLHRNRPKLKDNHRLRTIYSSWDRMSEDKRIAYLKSAGGFLSNLPGAWQG
ncbi:cryptochrome/photolyase family protein [Roseibium litorale]|uniref:Cryptochrome/photolyase family protein n=1 Tax=Roseibium litorale TaxID=2803841 RepID=A0ABR9CIA5_9HYPH|nr:cryptochrome/photolyase family protein [Roseibium litorale]MBD8890557.1 cryptochrome/photolyase family protein [Roseibium litorale]